MTRKVGTGIYLIGQKKRAVKVGKGILAQRPANQVRPDYKCRKSQSSRKYCEEPRVFSLLGGPGKGDPYDYALETCIHLGEWIKGNPISDTCGNEWFEPSDSLRLIHKIAYSTPYEVYYVDEETCEMRSIKRKNQEFVHEDCLLPKAHINLPAMTPDVARSILEAVNFQEAVRLVSSASKEERPACLDQMNRRIASYLKAFFDWCGVSIDVSGLISSFRPKGYTRNKASGRWICTASHDGVRPCLGTYATEEECQQTLDAWRKANPDLLEY